MLLSLLLLLLLLEEDGKNCVRRVGGEGEGGHPCSSLVSCITLREGFEFTFRMFTGLDKQRAKELRRRRAKFLGKRQKGDWWGGFDGIQMISMGEKELSLPFFSISLVLSDFFSWINFFFFNSKKVQIPPSESATLWLVQRWVHLE